MILYMGLDCSTKAIHCVVLNEQEEIAITHKWEHLSGKFEERFYGFTPNFYLDMSKIKVMLSAERELDATVEEAIYIQNPKTTVELAHVVGCVKMSCHLSGMLISGVDNRRWKKDILDKGNAKKPDIMEFAVDKWGKEHFPEQDFADAACIALYGLRKAQGVLDAREK